jgi:hypothetical protein
MVAIKTISRHVRLILALYELTAIEARTAVC